MTSPGELKILVDFFDLQTRELAMCVKDIGFWEVKADIASVVDIIW